MKTDRIDSHAVAGQRCRCRSRRLAGPVSSEEGEIDLFMQPPYDSPLEEVLEELGLDGSSLYGDEVITGTKVLIKIVIQYISCVSSQHGHVTDLLKSVEALPKLVEFKDNIDIMRYYFQELVSAMKELKVFFKVPNQHIISNITPTLNPNQVVAAFINFLLLMVEVILQSFEEDFIDCVKSSMEILQTELGFLITFLGDTASHLQPTNSTVMIDIEALLNEVGSFLYSFLFSIVVFILIADERDISSAVHMEVVVDDVLSFLNSGILNFLKDFPCQISKVEGRKKHKNIKRNEKNKAITDIKALVHEVRYLLYFIIFTGNRETGILHLALYNLLLKFELLKPKIKEHCIRVSKMPSVVVSRTAVVSLFIVDSVLDDLMDLINNKSERIVGVDDEIATLHEELMLLGSSITDIAVQHEAAEHEELVIQTRDIAYEVEFVINSFPHVWYLTLRLPQLLEKIHIMRMAIQEIKDKIDIDGIAQVAKYRGEQVSSQSKGPSILEDIVVGFEEVETEIVEHLVRGMDQLQIISISGMPGLGKTTLTKKLYNHSRVCQHFDVRAWCVASQTYKKRNMLIEILMSIGHLKKETIMSMKDEDLAEKLYKSLKGRRYLIVIDDIWATNAWNEMERYIPHEHVGSRILFTTRNKEVGLKTSASVMKELPFLSKDECWVLLRQKLFQKDECPRELLDIGKQIARNCHGLPLAVVAIAGVLANMEKKENMWRKVARNLTSHISENSDNCIRILELSYKHLPMHLKPCFLYFGAFEEDTEIPVRKLISLWIAEGYIKKKEHKCVEDVAIKYLMELIDRSLVLVARRRSDGQVKTCKIHDLLREMCLRIADEKNFLKVITFCDDDDPAQFFNQHHSLVINYGGSPINSLPFGLHVRSLLRVYLGSIAFNSRSLIVLRVLDFQRRLRYPLIGIEHLVHLRYLAISELPPMENFQKLEFLDVDNFDPVEIPDVLLNMLSLRRMYFRGTAYFSESCREEATNSERFQITSNLQSISALELSDETDEKILRCLLNLRRLTVCYESSMDYSFDFLNQLESLNFTCMGISSSSLISLPLYLKQLTLDGVHISPKEMEIIGRLLNLEVLKFIDVVFEGRHWDTREVEFLQLKFLKICNSNLAKWNASRDNFPRLEQLVLRNCKHLKVIPSSFSDIPTLQMIEVYGCPEGVKETAKRILEEQQDMGNEVLKVIISDLGSAEQEESGSEEIEKDEIQSEEQEDSGSEEQEKTENEDEEEEEEIESEEQEKSGQKEQQEKEHLKRKTSETQAAAGASMFLVLINILLGILVGYFIFRK